MERLAGGQGQIDGDRRWCARAGQRDGSRSGTSDRGGRYEGRPTPTTADATAARGAKFTGAAAAAPQAAATTAAVTLRRDGTMLAAAASAERAGASSEAVIAGPLFVPGCPATFGAKGSPAAG